MDYSDATPDVTYTYDRLGRRSTVSDAVGSRTLAYDGASVREATEALAGLYNTTLSHTWAQGRATGVSASGYSVAYGYDTVGRMNDVSHTVGSATGSAAYGYLPDSDLVETLTRGTLVQDERG